MLFCGEVLFVERGFCGFDLLFWRLGAGVDGWTEMAGLGRLLEGRREERR